ncbi:MAG: hypothetical protein EP330_13910 [Deltaproteobacteria bacterium]|nr:MAG: hypothetical protein EP330_13910 [Deltaproteobacteria bacterium]
MLTLLFATALAAPAFVDPEWGDPADRTPYLHAVEARAYGQRCLGGGCALRGAGMELGYRRLLWPWLSAGLTGLASSGWGARLDGRYHPIGNGFHGPFAGTGVSLVEVDRRLTANVDLELGWRGVWHPGFGYGFSARLSALAGLTLSQDITWAFGPSRPGRHLGFRGRGVKPEHLWPTAVLVGGAGLGGLLLGYRISRG